MPDSELSLLDQISQAELNVSQYKMSLWGNATGPILVDCCQVVSSMSAAIFWCTPEDTKMSPQAFREPVLFVVIVLW